MPKRKIKKKNTIKILLYSGFMSLTVGLVFAIIFFLGETYGFLPTISLGNLTFGQSGDTIILFAIAFMASVFVGSLIVFYMARKNI